MKKSYLIGGIVALTILCGIQYQTTKATTCLQGSSGGTGLCSASGGNIGQVPTVASVFNGTPVYTFQSGGGSASGTFTNVYGTAPIVVATGSASATVSCPTCIATNTGNWAGTESW